MVEKFVFQIKVVTTKKRATEIRKDISLSDLGFLTNTINNMLVVAPQQLNQNNSNAEP